MNAIAKQMAEEIRTELAQGVDLDDIKDRSGEYADSYLPVYNNQIIDAWKDMPSEYDERGRLELGAGDDFTIISLMQLDLYLYYTDLFFEALEEVEEALEEVAE